MRSHMPSCHHHLCSGSIGGGRIFCCNLCTSCPLYIPLSVPHTCLPLCAMHGWALHGRATESPRCLSAQRLPRRPLLTNLGTTTPEECVTEMVLHRNEKMFHVCSLRLCAVCSAGLHPQHAVCPCRYVRHEAEGTVQRLRQAQRRDAGLPFVDIIADSVGAPEQTAPHQLGRLSNGNAAAAAQLAGRPGADAEQVSLDQA
jgi:hypothetical protein